MCTVLYSGNTFIRLRSGKHDTSNAETQAYNIRELFDTGEVQIKPILLIETDGAQVWKIFCKSPSCCLIFGLFWKEKSQKSKDVKLSVLKNRYTLQLLCTNERLLRVLTNRIYYYIVLNLKFGILIYNYQVKMIYWKLMHNWMLR